MDRSPANISTPRVILINPFSIWRHRSYYKALEDWVQSAVDHVNRRQDTDIRLVWRRIRFSMYETLSKGQGQLVLDAVITKLQQQISGLVTDPKSLVNHYGGRGQGEGALLPLIFITHSIGLWVMEGALLDIRLPGFIGRPVGLVHLDGIEGGVPGIDYLDRLSGAFNIPIWSPPEVLNRFGAIHARFQQLAGLGSHDEGTGNSEPRSRPDMGIRVVRVWVPEEPVRKNDVSYTDSRRNGLCWCLPEAATPQSTRTNTN